MNIHGRPRYAVSIWLMLGSCILAAGSLGQGCPAPTNPPDDPPANETPADTDADGIADSSDNCVNHANADQLDTDGDGQGDVCDADDDNDGFDDAEDPASTDANNPGNFSNPQAILADARVQAALEQLESLGIHIETSTELNPPDIAGNYLWAENAGTFTATSNGEEVGRPRVGTVFNYTNTGNHTVSSTGYDFIFGSQKVGDFNATGLFIRGSSYDFTIYSTTAYHCTENGSDFTMHSIGIFAASVDPATGDLTNVYNFGVNVAVSGELTSACANRIIADQELVGGWAVAEVDRITRTD